MPSENERKLRRKQIKFEEDSINDNGRDKEIPTDDIYDSDDFEVHSLYHNLVKFKYVKVKSVRTDKEIQQLCLLNKSELFCVLKNNIDVYNLSNLRLKRRINLENLDFIKSIAEISKNRLVVACSNNNGLYEIASSGKHVTKIKDGSFCDVANCDRQIYALEETRKENIVDTDCIVSIFSLNEKDRLEKHKQLVVDAGSGRHKWDKIAVETGDIYISSLWNNCIYVYNSDGDIQHQMGEYGSKDSGMLYAPHLCGVDSMGNVLVADWNNDRLQVYDYQGKWHIVDVDIDIPHPSHAIVDLTTGHLIVASSDKLVLFQKESSSLNGNVKESRVCTIL